MRGAVRLICVPSSETESIVASYRAAERIMFWGHKEEREEDDEEKEKRERERKCWGKACQQ